jgi:predicted dienelactone hydrolase
MRHLCLLLAGLSLLGLTTTARAEDPVTVGVTTRSFVPAGAYDWRGSANHALATTIWYPADPAAVEHPQWIGSPDAPLASAGNAARDAVLLESPARFPLILVSHGTGGSAASLAWLCTALASHGAIVAAVNHPGNSRGDYTDQGFSLWWLRAKDVSTVLDMMLADPTFGPHIDRSRIGGAGFSLGGYTMAELAGGTTDLAHFERFCASTPMAGCKGPVERPELANRRAELIRSDPDFRAALAKAGDSYRDPRIRAVFLMAPGLAQAFSPDSLGKIGIPVDVVVGDDDGVAPTASAHLLAAAIPGAKLTVFPDGVSHFTFFAECTEAGRQAMGPTCIDAPTVDRAAIHRKTIALATDFFAAAMHDAP